MNKRIGILVQNFPVASETFIVNKVVGLMDRGFDVTVFAMNKSTSWDRFSDLQKRKDIRVEVSLFQYLRSPLKMLLLATLVIAGKAIRYPGQFFPMLYALVRSRSETRTSLLHRLLSSVMFLGHEIDVLHIEFDSQAIGLAEIKDWKKAKLVLSGRGSIARTNVLRNHLKFYNYIFKRVDYYHFISNYLYRESKLAGLPDRVPVSLIEPAINLKSFEPEIRAMSRSTIRLITVARLSWAKGIEFAVDAVALVAKVYPQIEYIIVGTGDYKEAIEFAITQNELRDSGKVRLLGEVSKEEVRVLLQSSDIMIHPALEEGFCNAVIEGQAMELPIVCSDTGGLPENIEDGVTGFVVPRRDAPAMAVRVLELIYSKELRQKMGQAGRMRALDKYNLTKQIDKFEALYNSIS